MVSTILFVLCYLALVQEMNCEPNIVYKMKNIECHTDPKYSTNASCRVMAINWNKSVANMDVDLVKPLKNISLQLQLFKKDYTNKYQPFLVNVWMNICSILSRQNFLPYGVIVLKVTKSFSNFNHTCPYEGHLFARGVYLEEQFLPNNLPLGYYRINVKVFETSPITLDYVGEIAGYVNAMEPIKTKKKNKIPSSQDN
ncbi:uncharacterized protein Dwil_GK27194 [Drosophila willistoni]|uniref:MD-2-related lipid-recognition domain-containing protein n=1 Tax=Drosophila willistoni TaxID=7260 RepID=A0A0Q9X5P2_DROWI|nr:uncharacterized protein LOC26529196 [Drosophila willistoni]KRG00190.1 uncharacterized protein Dwil_GK27194 [Drosophila willistoni]